MWLLKHKYKSNGYLERHNARLVCDGRSQEISVDCDETFSPVVKSATIRTVLSLAMAKKWSIHQFDVKNAFLHGDLQETVYMHQPSGLLIGGLLIMLGAGIISQLQTEFSMTDLGPLSYFLGIAVTRSPSYLLLSQEKYAHEILEHICSLASALQYLTFTRPDIAYAVQQVCLFMHDPRELHYEALKRILRYVQGIIDHGLHLYHTASH
ncbi:uncharacterized protein LOC110717459 [Chenopodium quinoa]|uniref:uncharacterized protein LOC110717459 n=1 Tax=Chenopodium quinoa TaxID=63459 RepID=UPI000B78AF7E|nr:uncharacterized protein LOC110717459 [Chenopodium quinoa]